MAMIIPERTRGRPRVFDEAEFLNGAIALFSAAGFSGVGINALTEATGLTVGSVYKAYRDKEGVFVKALEHYIALREVQIAALFEKAGNGRAKIEALLRLYVDLSLGKEGKLGCMVVAGIADLDQVGRAAELLRAQLSARRTLLTRLVTEGQRDGSVVTRGAPQIVAEVLLALLQGMRVVGKGERLTEDADAFVVHALSVLD
ncbi:TetR/AcrR family transcriptional regulator [Komagataeibacter europaeus]|uniref:TetR/AcrR family transcriptional regulator n=1 Tax=Komagataeibacter europaeus TaxID=33995 RepID=UPI000474D008|nr:TetR/AcrR family transcriptional regulator [Komagataeibacter europaeus]